MTRLATPIFDHAHPKIFNQLLIFVIMYQHAKSKFIASVDSSDSQFYSPAIRLVTPILIMFTPKMFNHLLICVKLYQDVKNKVVSSICSGEMVDLKILQFEWQEYFDLHVKSKILPK